MVGLVRAVVDEHRPAFDYRRLLPCRQPVVVAIMTSAHARWERRLSAAVDEAAWAIDPAPELVDGSFCRFTADAQKNPAKAFAWRFWGRFFDAPKRTKPAARKRRANLFHLMTPVV
jgi:hypothetical protein